MLEENFGAGISRGGWWNMNPNHPSSQAKNAATSKPKVQQNPVKIADWPTSKARCRGAERSGPDQRFSVPAMRPRSLNFYVSPWHLGTQNFDEVELMLLAFQRSWIFSKDEMVCPMKFYPLIPKRQRPAWDEQPGPSKVSSSNWVAPLIFAKSFSDSIQIRISLVDSLGIHVKVFGFSMSSQLLLASKIPHRLIRQFVSLFTVLYISQVSHEKKNGLTFHWIMVL